MLDGEHGEVRVRDEICLHAWQGEELAKQLAMPLTRLGNPHGLTAKPRLNLDPCLVRRCRTVEEARVGYQSQEGQQAGPRQAHHRRSIELLVEPFARARMLWQRRHVCVHEQVGIYQNHRNASLSATASTSPTLSMLAKRGRPRSTDCVRNAHSRRRARQHVLQSLAKDLVDQGLEPPATGAAKAFEGGSDVLVERQCRSHASKHNALDAFDARP